MNLLNKIKSILNMEDDESESTNSTATSDIPSYESNSSDASSNGESDTAPDGTAAESEVASEPAPETETDEADMTPKEDETETVDAAETDETETVGAAKTVESESQAEPESEPEPETDSGRIVESEPVSVIKGVGPTYAETLEEAGVETVAELASANMESLAEETEISPKRLERWIGRAEHR